MINPTPVQTHPPPVQAPVTGQQNVVTSVNVVFMVVGSIAAFALIGLIGTIYLCGTSSNPVLVAAAVKMIQTDPSSALAALQLLRTDASMIAIVSGLTGVSVGYLGGVLTNSRTQYPNAPTGTPPQHPLPMVKTDTPPGEAVAVASVPAAELESVATWNDLPADDPLNSVRLVRENGLRYKRVSLTGLFNDQWQIV